MTAGQRLRQAISDRRALLVPGAANALTARIIEDLGFEAIYLTGAGLANTQLGVPDIGLVTLTEVARATAAIAGATALPLVVDADTGFGNAINVAHTVRTLERAGAAAIQLEDQSFPKRCGHFAGKELAPAAEMVGKVKAAVDARSSPDCLIVARTDARAVEGLEAAIARADSYAEAGADATFVEAPESLAELAEIPRRLGLPQVANMVVGGKTPLATRDELAAMGFGLVLYANAALQASVLAMQEVLRALRRDGSLVTVSSRLADFAERQRLVGKAEWDALEARFADPQERR
ncbi:MAG TPA: isocitrate lyase/phosphoenolpyruvate mutase family protein [Stellaceae bacterium]|jgi:2-methylisocitrate lyase-like PEP mutase family enzyme|nr:isocitrate lyase/phosphoenolpyruvate mutase family protein [Stellaceae bacterium]